MQRRKFLTLGATAAAVTVAAPALQAVDFRKEKPDAWTAKSVDDALKALFGTAKREQKHVTVKTPDVASNGGAVPVDISCDIDCEQLVLLQDVNPESCVVVFEQNEHTVPKNSVKIKMKKSGTVYAVAKGKDGKLYCGKKTLEVALGGCEG
ncbi:MAG: thiosulfate oxidation carrier protein SoxY [Epsilonproteobacteria bacterium]|nr:thiosulfate oxidation carrier protein SoxY [Campylobacterota bacterium]